MAKGFSLLLVLLLTGCSIFDTNLFSNPALTASVAALQTKAAQVQATAIVQAQATEQAFTLQQIQSTFLPLTPEPIEIPTQFSPLSTPDAQAEANCHYWPGPGAQQPLPNLASLNWQMGSGISGRWLVLNGLVSPVLEAQPAPGGRWWAVQVLRQSNGPEPSQTALYVLDSAGREHWQASLTGQTQYQIDTWLPDNRLLWVDENRLWISAANGAEKKDLQAPEPVAEVWLGAGNLALVSGKTGLWRLDPNTNSWSQVQELDDLVQPGVSFPFSSSQANLAVASEGSFAGLVVAVSAERSNAELWKIPLSASEPAQKITGFSYLGHGGRMPAPTALAGTPYWFPGQMVGSVDNLDQIHYMLLDETGGKSVVLKDLLPAGQSLLNAWVSPDGQWLGLAGADQKSNPAEVKWNISFLPAATLEPVFDLTADSILAWRAFPAASWVVSQDQNAQKISQVDLSGGTEKLLDTFPTNTIPRVLIGANETLLYAEDKLEVFNLSGNVLGSFSSPVSLIETFTSELGPTGQVLLSGVQAAMVEGQCAFQFPIILWEVPDS